MTCISEKTLAFLMENRFRDSREWYHDHKADYTAHVLEPLQALVTELAPTLLEIDEQIIVEPKVDRTISRVYRDTRFSKDKSLYRENMWCVFGRNKKLYHGPPEYYFEFSPNGFSYGCGYYQADPKEMDAMRQMILDGSPAFLAAKKALDSQQLFEMEGDLYKRPRFPDAPQELQTWLGRKNISINTHSTDFSLLYSDRLAACIAEGYRTLEPVYRFFLEAHAKVIRK